MTDRTLRTRRTNAERDALVTAALAQTSRDGPCVDWTYPSGYRPNMIGPDGRSHRASRVLWWRANGDPDDRWVLHTCGRGEACIAVGHMYLGDRIKNAHDAVVDGAQPRGERGGRAKLTTADIVAIRASRDSQRALARRYGVSKTAIAKIIRRENWKHVD